MKSKADMCRLTREYGLVMLRSAFTRFRECSAMLLETRQKRIEEIERAVQKYTTGLMGKGIEGFRLARMAGKVKRKYAEFVRMFIRKRFLAKWKGVYDMFAIGMVNERSEEEECESLPRRREEDTIDSGKDSGMPKPVTTSTT